MKQSLEGYKLTVHLKSNLGSSEAIQIIFLIIFFPKYAYSRKIWISFTFTSKLERFLEYSLNYMLKKKGECFNYC